jgi:hypothetical protein
MYEKRTSKRIDMELAVEGQLVKRNFRTPLTQNIKLKTSDISKGGMRLKWPSGWKCETCDNCAGWIFNRDCQLKKGMDEPLNRDLNIGIRIRLRFLKKSINDREYYAKIVWKTDSAKSKSGYDTGLSFIGADNELIREFNL